MCSKAMKLAMAAVALFWSQPDAAKYPIIHPSNSFTNNLGIYGNNIASDPKFIFVGGATLPEDTRVKSINITNRDFFQIYVLLKDLYNQTVSDNAVEYPKFSLMLSSSRNGTINKLVGEVAQQFPDTELGGKGVIFDELTMAETPGEYEIIVEGPELLEPTKVNVHVAPCELGEILQTTASGTICKACEPGSFSGSITSSMCTKCPVNFYQDKPKQISCFVCPDGLEALQEGSSQCIDKKPGSIRIESVIRTMESFKEVTFAWTPQGSERLTGYRYEINNEEDFSGDTLFNGTVSGLENRELTVTLPEKLYDTQVYFRVRGVLNLAEGEWSATPRWSTVSDCRDGSVYLHAVNSDPREWKCEQCLLGTICEGAVWHKQLQIRPGYSRVDWAPSILALPLKCPYRYACLGGPITAEPTSLCKNGTTGPLCTVCAKGYGYQFGECKGVLYGT